MALPYGVYPVNHSLAQRGSWGGTAYSFQGVFLVGAGPAPSPFSARFTPGAIPRIRAQTLPGADAPYESTAWLRWLDQHPVLRYTSDGDPGVVSFPRSESARLAPKWRSKANPY